MKAIEAPIEALKAYIGTVIGKVRVNKPVHNDNRSFECAAWWQHEESQTGVFDVELVLDPFNKGEVFCASPLPAKVTDGYFGALWGGVAVSAYDKNQCVGRDATILLRKPLHEAILATGNSLDNEQDWYIIPELLEPAIAFYWGRVKEAVECLPYWWQQETSGGGSYQEGKSNMVGYCGRRIWENSQINENLVRERRYRAEGFLADCRGKNTEWAVGQPKQEVA